MHTTRDLRLSALQIAFLIATVGACRLLATRACPTYDDAFITYRYAANLAAGNGLVFNAGAAWEPVLGTTTPIYALLLAGFAKLGFDLVDASLGFNVLCDLVTTMLLVVMLGRCRVAATAAVLGFAALPELARISVGGMESPLFLLCAIAACAAVDARRVRLGGGLAAAICLVRPEGVLLAGILFIVQVRRPKDLVRFTVPILVVGASALAALTLTYGTPIPQSVTAKSAMLGPDPSAEKAARLWMILRQSFLPRTVYAAALPFAAYGLYRSLRKAGALRNFSLFALAISVSYVAARPHPWGWYFYVPLTGWVVWIALGAESAWRWLVRRAPVLANAVVPFAPQAASIAIVGVAAYMSARFPTSVPSLVYAPLWAWAERTSTTEPNARILSSDIGAIGHRWKGIVLDSEGLTWPEALVHNRHPATIIEATRPEYLMVVAERQGMLQLSQRPEVMAYYEAIARFNTTGKTALVLTPEDVPMDWSQDYLIYKRRTP